jgi:hypothetical protein
MQLDESVRARIRANIFPAAHGAIHSWDAFPWHCDRNRQPTAHLPWSSQALAIDVFGTISKLDARDRIVSSWMDSLDLPAGSAWDICLEWRVPKSILNETRPTQVDAAARSERNLVLFECKFTERSGGSCSQPVPMTKGRAKGDSQCSGSYTRQRNPLNGIEDYCALSGKGIRYWDWIPEVIGYDRSQSHVPCPFAGPTFQWMRNLVSAAAAARIGDRQPAFVLVYAGESGSDHFSVAREVRSEGWKTFKERANQGSVSLRDTSYTDLLDTAITAVIGADVTTLKELRAWVKVKESAAIRRSLEPSTVYGSDGV